MNTLFGSPRTNIDGTTSATSISAVAVNDSAPNQGPLWSGNSSTHATVDANASSQASAPQPGCLALTLQDFVRAAEELSPLRPKNRRSTNAATTDGTKKTVGSPGRSKTNRGHGGGGGRVSDQTHVDPYHLPHRMSQEYDSLGDFFQNVPKIDDSFFEPFQWNEGGRILPVEHGMVDVSTDATTNTTAESFSSWPQQSLQRRRSFSSHQSADSNHGASQPPAPPSPLRRHLPHHLPLQYYQPQTPLEVHPSSSSKTRPHPPSPPPMPAVSPKSVLDNIRRRTQRRKEILRHATVGPSHAIGDGTPVPTVVGPRSSATTTTIRNGRSMPASAIDFHDHGDYLDHHPQRRAPSPPSILSSFSVSTTEGQRRTSNDDETRSVASAAPPSSSVASTTLHSNVALAYWQDRVTERRQRYGPDAVAVGSAWMDLGHAQIATKVGPPDYEGAMTSFATAARVFQQNRVRAGVASSKYTLAWASALHHQGTATSRAQPNNKSFQVQALNLLQQALHARLGALGEDHPDTVATRNSLAWVFYNSHKYQTASESFWYVFWKRQAIFGPRHPAVAVAATDLARTFAKLDRDSDARNFYSIALQIYDQMNVPATNPTVLRLCRDLRALEVGHSTI